MFRVPTPHPNGMGPQVAPIPSICKLLAAFLRSSLVFARSLQHFWLPASHLLGTCYLLDDLRSTHTPSKYLRATIVIYTCAMYLLPIYYISIYLSIHPSIYLYYVYIYVCVYTHTYIYIYVCILYTYFILYKYTLRAHGHDVGIAASKRPSF